MDVNTALATAYLTISAPIGRRGFRKFMSVVLATIPGADKNYQVIDLKNGARFSFPSADAYWQHYFLTGTNYEPEISRAFDLVGERTSLFLDCGSNFGYWSAQLSKKVKTVAVEASSENFAILRRNQELNNNSFSAVHAAITETGGGHVWFATKPVHAGRNITTEDNNDKERVSTVTVDQLVREHHDGDGAVFVKLDVEGVEVEALKGSTETLKLDSVFVYEDHAKDRACLPTAFLLNAGKRVYFVDPSGAVKPILSVEDALQVKVKTKGFGYNFVALGDGSPPLA